MTSTIEEIFFVPHLNLYRFVVATTENNRVGRKHYLIDRNQISPVFEVLCRILLEAAQNGTVEDDTPEQVNYFIEALKIASKSKPKVKILPINYEDLDL